MARTADYMSRDETIAEGVAYLQGDCFCGQVILAPDWLFEDYATCIMASDW